MAFAADFVVNQAVFSILQVAGAVAVLLGFVLVNLFASNDEEEEDDDNKVELSEVVPDNEYSRF